MKTTSQTIFFFLFLMALSMQVNGQVLTRGVNSGQNPATGTYYGNYAGRYTVGQKNVFMGYFAGYDNDDGAFNTSVGSHAGEYQWTGSYNTSIGHYAGWALYEGSNNVFLGNGAGLNRDMGSNNVLIGYNAGYSGWNGSNNVFIGNHAGYSEQGSNRLYIANTSTTTPLVYGEFDNNRLAINGNLGIGTMTPGSQLHIANGNGLHIQSQYAQLKLSDITASMVFKMDNSGNLQITNGTLELFHFNKTGKLGIGTLTPEYKLDVCGTIRAREVKIDMDGICAPDYVFKEGYQLMGLQELEQFVQTNHHLPEIPSEKEMHENGVNLMELQMKLLQKIEELTLYTIRQEQRISDLEETLNEKASAENLP